MVSNTNSSIIASSIITGMLENYDIAESQRVGCQALSNFAHSEDNRRIISQEGGIETIIGAMNKFISNDDVQKEACKALSNLAINDENKIRIAIEGGIRMIVSAMKNHVTHEDVKSLESIGNAK